MINCILSRIIIISLGETFYFCIPWRSFSTIRPIYFVRQLICSKFHCRKNDCFYNNTSKNLLIIPLFPRHSLTRLFNVFSPCQTWENPREENVNAMIQYGRHSCLDSSISSKSILLTQNPINISRWEWSYTVASWFSLVIDNSYISERRRSLRVHLFCGPSHCVAYITSPLLFLYLQYKSDQMKLYYMQQ